MSKSVDSRRPAPSYQLQVAWDEFTAGNWHESERICVGIRSRYPRSVRCRAIMLGLSFARRTLRKAVSNMESAQQRSSNGQSDPIAVPQRRAMADAYRRLGEKQRALELAKELSEASPESADARALYAMCLLDVGMALEAEAEFRTAISKAPDSADYYAGQGLALLGAGFPSKALRAFKEAMVRAPESLAYAMFLAATLIDTSAVPEALEATKHLIEGHPTSVQARKLWAQALASDNRPGEAELAARSALDLDPDDAQACSIHGEMLQMLGRQSDAQKTFERAIELDPRLGLPYFGIVSIVGGRAFDPQLVKRMQDGLATGGLKQGDESFFHYALAKRNEDVGDFETSSCHYVAANHLEYRRKFGTRAFSEERHRARFDSIIDNFERLRRLSVDPPCDDDLPIFVVGMMRSGTTLVEQILASHPAVEGAGEQRFWPNRRQEAICSVTAREYERTLQSLATEYVAMLRRSQPSTSRVVDKMPANYQNLGLLTAAFRRPKIVWVRRSPADTCLSIYTTPNRERLIWAHNLSNISFNYQCYERLMAYWSANIPEGKVLEVRYEQLLDAPETEIRRILDFCELPWDDACLSPESRVGNVVTPSLVQVRRPMNRSSVGRADRFAPWLTDLKVVAGQSFE